MKKILVVVCITVMAATVNAYASPAVDAYVKAIASLKEAKGPIPTAPKGCGAVRNDATGDFLVLIPRESCKNTKGNIIPLGQTKYGSQVNGFCAEF